MLESVLLRCLAMPDKDTDSRQASKPTFAIFRKKKSNHSLHSLSARMIALKFRKTPGINGVGDRLKRLYR